MTIPSQRSAVEPIRAKVVVTEAFRLKPECWSIIHLAVGEPGEPTPKAVQEAAAATLQHWRIVIGTLLTVSLWNYVARQLKPSTVGALLHMIPVLAALAGVLLLDELITFTMILAGAVILAGVAISQFGPLLQRNTA